MRLFDITWLHEPDSLVLTYLLDLRCYCLQLPPQYFKELISFRVITDKTFPHSCHSVWIALHIIPLAFSSASQSCPNYSHNFTNSSFAFQYLCAHNFSYTSSNTSDNIFSHVIGSYILVFIHIMKGSLNHIYPTKHKFPISICLCIRYVSWPKIIQDNPITHFPKLDFNSPLSDSKGCRILSYIFWALTTCIINLITQAEPFNFIREDIKVMDKNQHLDGALG